MAGPPLSGRGRHVLVMAKAPVAGRVKTRLCPPCTSTEAAALAETLGVRFNASGATEPGTSLKRAAEDQPWSLCRRPWSLMYFTAHGRAIPCCIAPFSTRGYDGFTLGAATQQSLRQTMRALANSGTLRRINSARRFSSCAWACAESSFSSVTP